MTVSKTTLPSGLLQGKARRATIETLEFPFARHLPDDEQPVAVVLDNVFSPQECEQMVHLAEANNDWERAQINLRRNRQATDSHVRKSDRILWDAPDLAALIWNRVEPLLGPEVLHLQGRPRVTGAMSALQGHIWRAAGLNERLRFLRYGEGEFFKPHMDSEIDLPGRRKSFFTLHLYLNERTDNNELEGGATVMHSPEHDPTMDVAVQAKIGRVLVFQQRNTLHSGQRVFGGLKLTMRTDVMYVLDKELVPPKERMTLDQVRGRS